ncbi:ABC transporter permease [Aquimarina sp. ERC-38]|uniref:ABC transporter permease n=1 Tax=Aquimarina sp. ERC-38 TaxID=2949996 RepID=UPI0022468F59|nr:ABC transporter permease [Aquimarina sp. ERC-38]UZO80869.1 ABC transporter permease [Aquimarina sp. ERC-38]
MLRLLTIEFFKLKHSRAAKVITITYFVLFLFIALIASLEFDFAGIHLRIADQGIFNFPYIWHFNTYIAAFAKLFLAIVIVSMMSNEYSHRTLKQNLIDGLSKKEFIASKFLTVFVFALISTLFIFVLSLILGLAFSDYNEFSIITSDLEYLLAYFIKLIGFFSFCLFLGILVKRSAFALGFLFIWFIIENIIYALLKYKVFEDDRIADTIATFFPLTAMANLLVEPFTKLDFMKNAANQLGSEFVKDYVVHWYDLLIVCCWTVIFIYLSYLLLKKRDL